MMRPVMTLGFNAQTLDTLEPVDPRLLGIS
jgi:hypothetical protein